MNWRLFFVILFTSFLFPALILLLGSMQLFRLFLRKVTAPTPQNYRPIALTSAVAKVFETLLNSHFIKHLESNNLLSDHQHGFRKAISTGDLLFYLAHAWPSSLRNFRESFVFALDISKAFDRTWHKALLAKFPAYALLLPSVNSFPAFYPISLYLLLLTAQPLHPSRSPVVFLRVLSFHLLSFFSL